LNYYEKAIHAMLTGETPQAALWPLLQTWTLAVDVLADSAVESWRSACEQLRFTAAGFETRVNGLDQYFDEVEILLDELATQYGLETSTSI
jgi:primosomal protein N''